MWIDVGKLIREQVPDKNGKTPPSDLTIGSYELRDLANKAIGGWDILRLASKILILFSEGWPILAGLAFARVGLSLSYKPPCIEIVGVVLGN